MVVLWSLVDGAVAVAVDGAAAAAAADGLMVVETRRRPLPQSSHWWSIHVAEAE